MFDPSIFAATLVTATVIAFIFWRYLSPKRRTAIPGLNPLSKEDGNKADIARAGSLHQFLLELHAKFGSIAGFWMGQTYMVSIASPELFKLQAAVPEKPNELFQIFEPVFGRLSLQYADLEESRRRRHHYERAFSHQNLTNYICIFQELVDELEQKWLNLGEEDRIPLLEHMYNYNFKAVTRALLGKIFNNDELVHTFQEAYNLAWNELEFRMVHPTLPDETSTRMIQFKEAINYLHSCVKKAIDSREESGQNHCMLDDIIEVSTCEEMMIDDALLFLVAGTHTTSLMLTWCIYFLSNHQTAQEKLHEEIVQVLGEKGMVDSKNIKQLRYMQQVFDETLRCAIVAPYAARKPTVDSQLGGYTVPKNTPIIQALGVVFQNEFVWPSATKFDPDRFDPEERKKQHNYAFVPFGFAGRRNCPGNKFSYVEAYVMLAPLIRRWKITLWPNQVVKPVYGLVTRPEEEVWVKIIKRQKT